MLLARLAMSAFEDMPASRRDARSHMDAASGVASARPSPPRGDGRSAFATPCDERRSPESSASSRSLVGFGAESSSERSSRTRAETARKKYPYRADRPYTRAKLVASASDSAAAAPWGDPSSRSCSMALAAAAASATIASRCSSRSASAPSGSISRCRRRVFSAKRRRRRRALASPAPGAAATARSSAPKRAARAPSGCLLCLLGRAEGSAFAP